MQPDPTRRIVDDRESRPPATALFKGARAGGFRYPSSYTTIRDVTFSPIEYKPAAAEEAWFCACKRSVNKPMCDGSHKKV